MPELDGFELAAMIREHPRFQKTRDHLRLRRPPDRPRPAQGLRVRRGRLRVGAGRAGDPARQGQRLSPSSTARRAQLERLNRRARAARRRAHRPSSQDGRSAAEGRVPRRCSRTSCATRWRRSGWPRSCRAWPTCRPRSSQVRDVIERQVEHLVRLVDDLLDVSRITRGLISCGASRPRSRRSSPQAIESSRPLIDAKHHIADVTVCRRRVAEGRRRPARLTQVVGNLLNNAAKFTDPGGRIELTVRAGRRRRSMIEVTDTGIGISAEMLPRSLRAVHAGRRPLDRTSSGLGHRPRAGAPARRDAWRQGERAQRRPARAPKSWCACRCIDTRAPPARQRRPPARRTRSPACRRAAFWWSTTTSTPPRRSR